MVTLTQVVSVKKVEPNKDAILNNEDGQSQELVPAAKSNLDWSQTAKM